MRILGCFLLNATLCALRTGGFASSALKMSAFRGSLRGRGRTIRWDSGICWLPGEGHLCSHVRPLTICPRRSHGISTHREQPSVPLPGHSSRLPWASVCAEGLLVFHESSESHCPLFLHLSDMNTEVLKGTCCCWSLAVTIVSRDCESCSLRPVSCFWGNPESQMITYELLTLLDK